MLVYDIFSLSEAMIKGENLQEVTSPKIFIREGEPDPEGLASYDIFGIPGTEERKRRFGYIMLNDIFVHPHCLFELKSIKRYFADMIDGVGEYYVDGDGELQRVDGTPPPGVKSGTGARFLYEIWDKLSFDFNGSTSGVRFNRLRFIKSLDKKNVFMNKILVIPPFYRDVDMSGDKKNEINTIYISLMNLAASIKSTENILGTFEAVSDSYRTMNQILVDFHEMIVKMYGGRKGFIHKYIMGKAVDFSARLVISCVDLSKAHSPAHMDATYGKSKVPLFAIIKCFAPFIVNGIREIITDFLHGSEYMTVEVKSGLNVLNFNKIANKSSENTEDGSNLFGGKFQLNRTRLASDWQKVLTSQYIYNLIEIYHDSPEHRLDVFTLPGENGEELPVGYYIDEDDIPDSIDNDLAAIKGKVQKLTLVQLFYMAAYDKVRDKHVYVTRYPIEDHNNTYPSGMNIIPYKRTAELTIGDTKYPNFPIVKDEDKAVITSMFVDSLVIFPAYLSALDGDFDGDMVSLIGIFSEEANAEAGKHIYSVGNMTAINGTTTRKLGTLCQHVVNGMTYHNYPKNIN